ncbi:hypothetical protein RJ640_007010 [Escallonia rubra]|uniref:Uncharacterized protein n=1 Tax=Escallonia rubra TaxID=112253 RepID=A0AA88RA06_9ASTE|nr:hypothetical protein RJ640_007010 [Escallonia rubra]
MERVESGGRKSVTIGRRYSIYEEEVTMARKIKLSTVVASDDEQLSEQAMISTFEKMTTPVHLKRKTQLKCRITINTYRCNMDNKVWDHPKEWRPERFLTRIMTTRISTMAFERGKRVCAAALQAMPISCMAIGRFRQEFE